MQRHQTSYPAVLPTTMELPTLGGEPARPLCDSLTAHQQPLPSPTQVTWLAWGGGGAHSVPPAQILGISALTVRSRVFWRRLYSYGLYLQPVSLCSPTNLETFKKAQRSIQKQRIRPKKNKQILLLDAKYVMEHTVARGQPENSDAPEHSMIIVGAGLEESPGGNPNRRCPQARQAFLLFDQTY